jgi:hypothetical protein
VLKPADLYRANCKGCSGLVRTGDPEAHLRPQKNGSSVRMTGPDTSAKIIQLGADASFVPPRLPISRPPFVIWRAIG